MKFTTVVNVNVYVASLSKEMHLKMFGLVYLTIIENY